jgi:uncharacterized membrane protein (UPF0127 family)
MARRLTAVNETRAVTLVDAGRVADHAWTRLVGLLRDTGLKSGDGLWINPCNSIHSFAMKFVFDAVFLDASLRVVRLYEEMKPWRVSAVVLTARSVLELPAGTIAQTHTRIGDQFKMTIRED